MTTTVAAADAPVGAPYQWPVVRAVNRVARGRSGKVTRLPGVEELVDAARRTVGSHDLGADDFREPLGVLLGALDEQADLTPVGRWFARGALLTALVNRGLVARALVRDPAIAARPVGPAIVVVGLPRSGTTLLQRLLSLDPDTRSLRQWEAQAPAPPPRVDADPGDPRIRASQRATWLLDRLAPDARVLHPTGPRLPTECVSLFANSLASLEFGVIHQVPRYVRWCLQADMAAPYAYYATQLQVLGRHGARVRWVLKSPAHLFWTEHLLATLPEAVIVQVHRDPGEVMASYCGLVEVHTAISARVVGRAAIGPFWTDVWCEGVRRAEQVRRDVPLSRWVDVRYRDLVADPVGAVAAVYDHVGDRFPDALAAAVRQGMDDDPRPRRRVAARPTLARYGLDAGTVQASFGAAAGVRRH